MRSGSATELSAYAYQCAIKLTPFYTYSDKSDGGSWIQRFILGVGPGAAAVSRITGIRATLYLKVDGSGISSGMQNCLTRRF
jgi:hypothetical protein